MARPGIYTALQSRAQARAFRPSWARHITKIPEAVKRLRDMQFGRGCKDLMFKMIKQGAAFNHADKFIDEAVL
jgi:hypothetical protein